MLIQNDGEFSEVDLEDDANSSTDFEKLDIHTESLIAYFKNVNAEYCRLHSVDNKQKAFSLASILSAVVLYTLSRIPISSLPQFRGIMSKCYNIGLLLLMSCSLFIMISSKSKVDDAKELALQDLTKIASLYRIHHDEDVQNRAEVLEQNINTIRENVEEEFNSTLFARHLSWLMLGITGQIMAVFAEFIPKWEPSRVAVLGFGFCMDILASMVAFSVVISYIRNAEKKSICEVIGSEIDFLENKSKSIEASLSNLSSSYDSIESIQIDQESSQKLLSADDSNDNDLSNKGEQKEQSNTDEEKAKDQEAQEKSLFSGIGKTMRILGAALSCVCTLVSASFWGDTKTQNILSIVTRALFMFNAMLLACVSVKQSRGQYNNAKKGSGKVANYLQTISSASVLSEKSNSR